MKKYVIILGVVVANIINSVAYAEVFTANDLKNAWNTTNSVTLDADINWTRVSPITDVYNYSGTEEYLLYGNGYSIYQEHVNDGGVYRFLEATTNIDSGIPISIESVIFENFEGISTNYMGGANKDGGGVIWLKDGTSLGNISADFISNSLSKEQASGESRMSGGVLLNQGTIYDITGKFLENAISLKSADGGNGGVAIINGGVITNAGNISSINGEFTNNNVEVSTVGSASGVKGGVIDNSGVIGSIGNENNRASFNNNSVKVESTQGGRASIYGGVLHSSNADKTLGTIGEIYADVTNTTLTQITNGDIASVGGVFLFNSNIDYADLNVSNTNYTSIINDDYDGNGSNIISNGGGLFLGNGAKIDNFIGNFSNNEINATIEGNSGKKIEAQGGAMFLENGEITNIFNSSFSNNVINTTTQNGDIAANGGAMAVKYSGSDRVIVGDIKNTKFSGNQINAVFDSAQGGSGKAYGGALYTEADLTLTNTSFTDNGITISAGGNAEGGAIYSSANLDIVADGGNSVFDKNIVKLGNSFTGNDIYMANADKTLTLTAKNNGTIQFNSGINGSEGYNIAINGDDSGKIIFNSSVEGKADIDVNDMVVTFGSVISSEIGNLTGSGTINNKGVMKFSGDVNFDGTFNQYGGGTTANGQLIFNKINIHEGFLTVSDDTVLNNLILYKGAYIDTTNISDSLKLSGNTVFYSGSFLSDQVKLAGDFKNLTLVDSVPIVGSDGVGALMNLSTSNFTDDKTLNLIDIDEKFSTSSNKGFRVGKWDTINIGSVNRPSNMKLIGDLEFNGTNKLLNINKGSSLDVSGNSPANYTINGNVYNDGLLDFTAKDFSKEADDVLNITGNYEGGNNSVIAINADPVTKTSDVLSVGGDLKGKSKLFVKTPSAVNSNDKILFLEAPNDDQATQAEFDVWRVQGSAYIWQTMQDNNNWYLYTDRLNFTPETAAYMGMHSISLTQTAGMLRNLQNKVINAPVSKGYSCNRNPYTGYYDCGYKTSVNMWFTPAYNNLKVEAPFEYDANVYGGDAGIDMIVGDYGRLGLFASYRKGIYDFSGKGREFTASGSSDVDMDSYIGGVYYDHEIGNFWALATLFGGINEASVSTDDGVDASLNGTHLGASFDIGYAIKLPRNWNVEPTVGIHYSRIDFEDSDDSVGMLVSYDAMQQFETEAGIKFERFFVSKYGVSNLYLKPSFLQTFNDGNSAEFMGVSDIATLDDDTYVRLEIGGSIQYTPRWKFFGTISNTFNSDYRDTSLNLGLNYTF